MPDRELAQDVETADDDIFLSRSLKLEKLTKLWPGLTSNVCRGFQAMWHE